MSFFYSHLLCLPFLFLEAKLECMGCNLASGCFLREDHLCFTNNSTWLCVSDPLCCPSWCRTSSWHRPPCRSSPRRKAAGSCCTLGLEQSLPGCWRSGPLASSGRGHMELSTMEAHDAQLRVAAWRQRTRRSSERPPLRKWWLARQDDEQSLTAVHSERICHSLQIFCWQVLAVSGRSRFWQWLVWTLRVRLA